MNLKKYRRYTTREDGSIILTSTPIAGYTVQDVSHNAQTTKFEVCRYKKIKGTKFLEEEFIESFEFDNFIVNESELDDFVQIVKKIILDYQLEHGYTGTSPIKFKIKGDPFASFFMHKYQVDDAEELKIFY